MTTFGNKKEQSGRGRSRGAARPGAEDKDKKDSYKKKRSFTKNKSYRENMPREDKAGSGKPYRSGSFKRDDRGPSKDGEKKFAKKAGSFGKTDRPFTRKSADEFEKPIRRVAKTDGFEHSDRPTRKPFDRDSKPKFEKRSTDRPARTGESREDKPRFGKRPDSRSERPARDGDSDGNKPRFGRRPDNRPSRNHDEKEGAAGTKRVKFGDFEEGKAFKKQEFREKPASKSNNDGLTRLNKYLANAGIASRREADTLIQSGIVKVNGVVVDQLGYKVKPGDKVTYGDAGVKSERKVYLLLNKPKDYITTVEDDRDRKTVMELVAGACKERIYPVGRLDRNTTGLLLMTNDGDMTKKLTHPKFGVKKIYHVTLNKGLKADDFSKIMDGLELEDGPVKVDDIAFVGEGKKEIGIEIHSGRNRVVRRIFEHLGYDVLKLDRVVFAGLTKKDLPRGKHRFLTGKEISFLQMIG